MRSRQKTKLRVQVTKVQFVIHEERKKSHAVVDYERYYEDKLQSMQTKFALLSCWVDPQKQDAVKAHLIANHNNPMHTQLLKDIQTLGLLPCIQNFCITSDGIRSKGTAPILRYGKHPQDNYTSQNEDTYDTQRFYDSKAKALTDLLEYLGKFQVIGGLNLVSLQRLPDSILIESGYTKIPDSLKWGVPMWAGTREKAIAGQSAYDTAGSKKSARQFLDLIAKAVNIPT